MRTKNKLDCIYKNFKLMIYKNVFKGLKGKTDDRDRDCPPMWREFPLCRRRVRFWRGHRDSVPPLHRRQARRPFLSLR